MRGFNGLQGLAPRRRAGAGGGSWLPLYLGARVKALVPANSQSWRVVEVEAYSEPAYAGTKYGTATLVNHAVVPITIADNGTTELRDNLIDGTLNTSTTSNTWGAGGGTPTPGG